LPSSFLQLSENVRRGMDENALQCQYNGVAPPPGYKVVDKKYAIDEDTAPLVRRVFEMYAKGYRGPEIMAGVNAKGFQNHKGKPFTQNMLHRILHNEKYIGIYRWRDIVIKNGVPAIIDRETFERVQQRMKKRKKAPAASKAVEPFILTGKLFCGKCEGLMTGDSGTSRDSTIHYYYTCAKKKKRMGCRRKSISKRWIEDLVINEIIGQVLRKEVLEEIADAILKYQESSQSALPLLLLQKAEIDKKLKNILTAIEQGIVSNTTQNRLLELESEKADIEIKIAQERLTKPLLTKKMIMEWFDRFSTGDVDSLKYRQLLIDFFVQEIVLYDDKLVVILNYQNRTKDVEISHAQCSDIMMYGTSKGIRTPVTAVRGRCPRPLDHGGALAAELGFEPRRNGSEPFVLPLHYSATRFLGKNYFIMRPGALSTRFAEGERLSNPD
jgi:site-specific DNA recombinase